MKYVYLNGNPWQRFLPDCSIRALALGLNMSYIEVCRKLQVKCEKGYGLIKTTGACSTEKIINNFKSYFITTEVDEIYDAASKGNEDILSDKNMDVEAGFSVEEQAEMLPPGKYIFILRPTKEERKHGEMDWHATLVDTEKDCLYDVINCIKENNVYGYLAINPEKRLKNSDPNSFYNEIRLIDKGYLWGDKIPPYIKDKAKWKNLQKFISNPKHDKNRLKGGIINFILSNQRREGETDG